MPRLLVPTPITLLTRVWAIPLIPPEPGPFEVPLTPVVPPKRIVVGGE